MELECSHQDSKRPSARPPGSEPCSFGPHTKKGSAPGPALNSRQGPFRLLQPLPWTRKWLSASPPPPLRLFSASLPRWPTDIKHATQPKPSSSRSPLPHAPPRERVLRPPTWRPGLRMLLPPPPPPSVGSLILSSPHQKPCIPYNLLHPLWSTLTAHLIENLLPLPGGQPPLSDVHRAHPGMGLWRLWWLPHDRGTSPKWGTVSTSPGKLPPPLHASVSSRPCWGNSGLLTASHAAFFAWNALSSCTHTENADALQSIYDIFCDFPRPDWVFHQAPMHRQPQRGVDCWCVTRLRGRGLR